MDLAGFERMLHSGRLRPEHRGRSWVCVSLAEAETLRRVMHMRADQGKPLVGSGSGSGSGKAAFSTEAALLYSPLRAPLPPGSGGMRESGTPGLTGAAGGGGLVLDASLGWRRKGSSTGADEVRNGLWSLCMSVFYAV